MNIRLMTAGAIVALAIGTGAIAAMDPMVGGAAMYPTRNIVQNAVNSRDHTTLVAAVKAAGLVPTLEGAGPFTVFAPTNEAFAALPPGTVANLLKPENKAELTKILTYHVVAGRYTPAQLAAGKPIKTLEGGTVTPAMTGGTYTVNGADVVCGNVQTSNATVYIISSVLMPSS
jgi:uncharacterized surface protein with fasciclin (FAS1) repeats